VTNLTFLCHHTASVVFSGEEPPESLFMKELKRRGMTPTSLLDDYKQSNYELDEEVFVNEEDRGIPKRKSVSTNVERSLENQRERSMALNSEGLEVDSLSTFLFLKQFINNQLCCLNGFVVSSLSLLSGVEQKILINIFILMRSKKVEMGREDKEKTGRMNISTSTEIQLRIDECQLTRLVSTLFPKHSILFNLLWMKNYINSRSNNE